MSRVNLLGVGQLKNNPGVRGESRLFQKRLGLAALGLLFSVLQASSQSSNSIIPGPKPADASPEWKELVGIYKDGKNQVVLLERSGTFFWHKGEDEVAVRFYAPSRFILQGVDSILDVEVERNSLGKVERILGTPRSLLPKNAGNPNGPGKTITFLRSDAGSDPGHFYVVTPARPVEELRNAAHTAEPPEEPGAFRNPDLVELATLDSTIHLDIRYATSNDFLGTPVYTQARAFLQRPAAEALLRVLHKLQPLGYGLLVYDGYRPWYVTKIFWDATPPEGKIFVADPAQGSRHNRGCAVDLTLYDLKTGQPVEMTGGYDEMSQRSFPDYPGGTSLQRWNRDLLRRAMESEGFTVYESEWWHFDYKDWREYGILNVPFEKLGIGSATK